MEIPATCFTNLDDYRQCEWPNRFLVLPKIGDFVEAKNRKTLKVVRITHKLIQTEQDRYVHTGTSSLRCYEAWAPFIEIELSK